LPDIASDIIKWIVNSGNFSLLATDKNLLKYKTLLLINTFIRQKTDRKIKTVTQRDSYRKNIHII